MKRHYISLLVVIVVCTACSINKEFIESPKVKKKYVSEQQYLELQGDIILAGTNATGALADLSKTVFSVTKNSLDKVNQHIDGQKSSLNKVQRTECYEIELKMIQELDFLLEKAEKIQKCLGCLLQSLDQKIQSE